MPTGPNYRPNIQLPNLMGHTGNPYDLNLYPQDMIFEKPAGWDDTKGVIDTSNPQVMHAGFNFGNNRDTNNVSLPPELMGGPTSILDYGINTLANKFNNYAGSNRRQNYNQSLTDWGSPMGDVPDQPMMPGMLDQTGQMGAYTNTPRTPEGIPFNPAQGNTGRWDQQNVPDKKGFSFNPLNWGIGGMMKKMIEPNTPEENFGREYFKDSMDSSGRIYNNAGDLFGGKIPVSAFGKGMGAAGQKRIDTINATLAKWKADPSKYGKELDEEGNIIGTTLYDKRANFINQLNRYKKNLQASTGGQDPTIDISQTEIIDKGGPTITTGAGGDGASRDQGGGYTTRGGFTGTRGQEPGTRGGATSGSGRGHHSWRAEGGRIGYQDGELVEDEYMAEATPRGMMEENIEEVQGEPTREQLEAIALEIFRLPLEELNEEQLNVVYQAAMEQEPSEEEVQFAAQEGPGQGIASLV